MPLLDVTVAILDPMFLDVLSLTRLAQSVGTNGRATNTPTTAPIYGVVTNDKGDMLNRTGDAGQVLGNITVHTLERLSAGTESTEADIVTWDGSDYTVDNVSNYSRYGQGFTACSCTVRPIQGGA